MRRNLVLVLLVFCVAGVWSRIAQAQVDNDPEKTLLEVDLVLPMGSSNPLLAQKWRQEFEQIGEAVRIRSFLADDKPAVTERERGPFRVVKIIGMIDLEGTLSLPDRTFKPGQATDLKAWLEEVKTYGAQGSPAGKPNWGLSEEQLSELRLQLGSPVTRPVRGLTLQEALSILALPRELPLVPHSSVADHWKTAQSETVTEELSGLTAGTSLAFLLSQQGLGFRPVRLPSRQIQLLVEPLSATSNPWPVGWPENEETTRSELVPGLFKSVETGVQQAPLISVLEAIEEKTDTRLLIDVFACQAKELNPSEILVSYPRKKTAWALIVSSVVVNSHMSMHYRQDEAGTGFIWITPFARYSPPSGGEGNKKLRSGRE